MIDFPELFGASPNPYMVLDRALRFVAVNEAYLQVTGRERHELLGVNLFDAFPGNPDGSDDNNVRALRDSLERAFRTGERHTLGLIRYAIAVPTPEGRTEYVERFWSATHTPLRGADGQVDYVLQHTVDVTEMQRLKAELRDARARQALSAEQIETGVFERAQRVQLDNDLLDSQRRHLLKLFDEAPGFMAYLSGPQHVFELVNGAYLSLIGQRDVVGLPIREALPEIAGQGYYELLESVYASGKPFVGTSAEVTIERAGGYETVWLDFIYQPVFDARGQVTGVLVQGNDITSQKQAQAELEAYRRQLEELVQARTQALERTEAALVQARKLEDLGKLTGGVAHDFNNVLQVIAANVQLLETDSVLPPAQRTYASAAMQGVERGARLASQLLAFARRQPLQPVTIDLGDRLVAIEALLRGTLGEAIDLRLSLGPDLCPVRADPHQLDNALLNLALNARDAMQGRGELRLYADAVRVETPGEDLTPGQYVLLRIIDSGCGMTPEVQQQAFEPFFTTKDVGQGTGLGLSMVYGFAKQSGGHVDIVSSPGAGTEIRLWLPCSSETPQAVQAPVVALPTGHETILVVEDEPAVRASVVGLVEALGYRVETATDGEDALARLQTGLPVDLLFTDVVMPGRISGIELARRARMLRPDLPILFTSGFAQDALEQDAAAGEPIALLAKPYRRDELARRLREALDRTNAPRRSLRVLLVEDQPDSRITTQALLRALGHQPHAVATAAEALAALAQGAWDVLLTDLHLVGASGAELAAKVRARWPRMRIVLASGATRAMLDAADADARLQKPYGIEALQQALGMVPAPVATGLMG